MAKTIQTTVMEIDDLKKIGITGATDAALIMGAWQSAKTKDSVGRLSCRLYSATGNREGRVGILETDGESITCACDSRFVAVRPSLLASDFSVLDEEGKSDVLPTADNPMTLKINNKVEVELSVDPQGRYVFYYGVFPQAIAPSEVAQKLETMEKEEPKRFYHINPSKLDNTSNLKAEEWEHGEYVLDDRRYVRMTATDSGQILSNGEKVVAGKNYWCEVRPIQWIYDPKGQRAYSDLALFAGIPWETKEDAPKWLFKKGDRDPFLGCGLEDYLVIMFSEDMMSSYASCMKQEQKRAFQLDDWLKKNPNPQAKDFFKRPFWKQGKRVIDLILEKGNEAISKAFPAEKWIDPKRRSTLQEIFSGVELTQENKLLLIRLETRLRKAMVAHLRQQSAGKIKKPDKTL